MWKLIKYCLLLALALIVIPVGYFVGPFFTPVTAENVEGRLYRVCVAGVFMKSWVQRSSARRSEVGPNLQECECVAEQAVKTVGAPLAAQLTEAARQLVIDNVTSRSREGASLPRGVDAMGRTLETAVRMCRSRAT